MHRREARIDTMGTAHSKKTTENLEQRGPTAEHVSAKRDNALKFKAPDRHQVRNERSRHPRATTVPRLDTQEEEKLPESFSESDLRQMMQSMGNMDRRHHHASRAAVHPITTVDGQHYYEQHPSRNMPIIESLPPPIHEVKKRLRGSSSLPVRCPSRRRPPPSTNDTLSSFSEDDDAEYLSKIYDLRTWNMYKLITEARRKQQFQYQPSSVVEEKTCELEDDVHVIMEEQEDSSSFTANMIFAFDYE